MKLAVEFPSVAYREGGAAVARLAREIERIGYDQLDMFDHVVMGHPVPGRAPGRYPARMPILEALMTLSYVAATTQKIGLGTEVLILPQRQPVLVAKQIATLDVLSGGRVRLGVGVGWQEAEYEALGVPFSTRGRRMDEAIALLRACWRDESIDSHGPAYAMQGIAMEPKPPQRDGLPIWIGGNSDAALRRVGRLGDGWLASATTASNLKNALATIRAAAMAAGRDPDRIGLQAMLEAPPREGDAAGRAFYADLDRVVARAAEVQAAGFGWLSVNATAIFQAGARSVDAIVNQLDVLHARLRREVGAA